MQFECKRSMKKPPLTAKVLECHPIAADVRVLRISRPDAFDFAPGQRVKVSVGGKKRPYNIASVPSDAFLELCIERVKDGLITPQLWALQAGDPVYLRSRAKGSFVLAAGVREHLMVATVTGIAPFRSMLLHALGMRAQSGHFTILHGAPHCAELVYREELEALSRQHPDRLSYIPVVSRPEAAENAGWSGETGDVSSVAVDLVESFDAGDTQVYACGHPAMIADVRLGYRRRDFSVLTEAFWKV